MILFIIGLFVGIILSVVTVNWYNETERHNEFNAGYQYAKGAIEDGKDIHSIFTKDVPCGFYWNQGKDKACREHLKIK